MNNLPPKWFQNPADMLLVKRDGENMSLADAISDIISEIEEYFTEYKAGMRPPCPICGNPDVQVTVEETDARVSWHKCQTPNCDFFQALPTVE